MLRVADVEGDYSDIKFPIRINVVESSDDTGGAGGTGGHNGGTGDGNGETGGETAPVIIQPGFTPSMWQDRQEPRSRYPSW